MWDEEHHGQAALRAMGGSLAVWRPELERREQCVAKHVDTGERAGESITRAGLHRGVTDGQVEHLHTHTRARAHTVVSNPVVC